MRESNRLVRKQLQLDPIKLKRAQRILNASTETEAIKRALEFVIAEDKRNRAALRAHREFLRSGAVIRDVFGATER